MKTITILDNASDLNIAQNKLLSICILSYNQPDAVQNLLSSLVRQITNDVEIIIKDDSIGDATELVIKEYSDILNIRYYRGVREGIDKAVVFLIENALGKFIWWLGDDIVTSGGVGSVLNTLTNHLDVDFIWANYQLVGSNKMGIDLKSGDGYISKDTLLELGGAGLGFISATIFRRQLGIQGLSGAKKYMGSLFANLYIILYVISQARSCYYLRGPIIECHPTSGEETKKIVTQSNGVIKNRGFEVYALTYPSIIREFSTTFSSTVIRYAIKRSFTQCWKGIYVGWVSGWDTPSGKKSRLIKDYWRHLDAYLAIFLFNLPLSLNKLMYRLYKKLKF